MMPWKAWLIFFSTNIIMYVVGYMQGHKDSLEFYDSDTHNLRQEVLDREIR